ncbi:MAG: ferredoxin [Rhodoferax sp.]|nr:ferredoxin [Rhodoferax sp.]
MIVCVCHRVSDREIARHVRAGLSFDDIQFELGVATQCGQCESCARDVVAQCSVSSPVAALHSDFEPTQAARGFDCAAPGRQAHAHVSVVQLASAITESRAWNSSHHSAAV